MDRPREDYYQALATRLQSALVPSVLVSVTRRALGSAEIPAGLQPALELRALGSSPRAEPSLPPLWTLGALAVVYLREVTTAEATEAAMHVIADAIEAALYLRPGETGDTHTTLGGLARWARISGEIEQFPADSSGQAHMIVPLEIFAA